MEWLIVKRKLSELHLLENNPRQISENDFLRLKRDLKLGKFKPFVIDTNNVILGGNQTYRAMMELVEFGADYVALCSIPERPLTKEEREDVIIADNEHRGEYDIDILANEYEDALKRLGYEDRLPKELEAENEEVNVGDFEDTGTLVFKLPKSDYMRALQLLANAVEKTESDSNEECIMKLLEDYE